MRRSPTEAERILWGTLRGRRLAGLKSRRQVWLSRYIVDFLCPEARLIVEVDGGQHGDALSYDAQRDRDLQQVGFRTLRFWNNQVLNEPDAVLEAIRAAALSRLPSPSRSALPSGPLPLPSGEGI